MATSAFEKVIEIMGIRPTVDDMVEWLSNHVARDRKYGTLHIYGPESYDPDVYDPDCDDRIFTVRWDGDQGPESCFAWGSTLTEALELAVCDVYQSNKERRGPPKLAAARKPGPVQPPNPRWIPGGDRPPIDPEQYLYGSHVVGNVPIPTDYVDLEQRNARLGRRRSDGDAGGPHPEQ